MQHRTISFRRLITIASISLMLVLHSCVSVAPPAVATVPPAPIAPQEPSEFVKSGLEVFLAQDHSKDSLRYGLLTNQTCVNRDLVHGVELLPQVIDLVLILSPEHGLFGAENAGDKIESETDPVSGIQSLTTYRKKPPEIADMLGDIDVVLFDIQDIGVRSYTYIYSMAYLMEATAIAGKKVVILDRPNPINGIQMEGNILDPGVSSFVGLYPIPYRHGMTTGELAQLFNSEFDIHCELEVVPMDGWTRDMWFDETGLPWIPTSPHVPDAATILPMISTGTYGELGKLSEGVGTTIPFEYAGGPWIKDPHTFAKTLQENAGGGKIFKPTFFKPYYGRHKGQICGGVQLFVTDRDVYSPYLVGLQIMATHQQLYPDVDLFENKNRFNMFAKVMGSRKIQEEIQSGANPREMQQTWLDELNDFAEMRQKYLLYN